MAKRRTNQEWQTLIEQFESSSWLELKFLTMNCIFFHFTVQTSIQWSGYGK
ncbi:hypothetical protein [Vibrio parahaemolyticus]